MSKLSEKEKEALGRKSYMVGFLRGISSGTRGEIEALLYKHEKGLRLKEIEKLTRDMASGSVDSKEKVRNRQAYLCRVLKEMIEEGDVEKHMVKGDSYPRYFHSAHLMFKK